MNVKISVVIPTYQRPGMLQRCLQTLVTQNFEKDTYEIIIVSDGPDLSTANVVQQYSQSNSYPVIRYFCLPENRGPAAARNVGWQNANGKLIAFIDDDCQAHTDWLHHLWKGYNGKEEPAAYTGKIVVPLSDNPTDYELNTAQLEKAEFVTANCACTQLALQITGGFDEEFRMAWREDSDLHFKLIQFNIPIEHIEEAVVIHPVRRAPWGISIKEQKKSMFNALLYKKYPKLYREKIQQHAPVHYYIIVLSFLLILIGLLYSWKSLTVVAFLVWFLFTARFITKRLSMSSRSLQHVTEIIFTSLIIPFLSVYWRCYGSFKFKTLFI